MNQRSLIAWLIVAAAGTLVAVLFFRAAGDTAEATRGNACRTMNPDPVPAALRHQDAPDFELPDVTGKKWSLKSLRGRPVLLNFWATWCPPCVEEMPSMEDLARSVGDRAVVLAVSVDEDWDALRRFFPRGTPLSVLLDQSKATAKRYGTEKYPESYLIGADGEVKHYFINTRKWGEPEAAACLESLQ
ncbi:MAG TPA: TlpA disulfide reductase family protein [Polyangia bacterium]|nr:TlpA disulfide reductase family protein [Polyangia bacterium]